MAYFRIKHRFERRRFPGYYVTVRLPSGERMEVEETVEAPNAREAVLELLSRYRNTLYADDPVWSTSVVHNWPLRNATVGEFIDLFLSHQWRGFVVRLNRDNLVFRVFSVEETENVECPVCAGTGLYRNTDEVCYGCNGEGRMSPEEGKRLNREYGEALEKLGMGSASSEAEIKRIFAQAHEELKRRYSHNSRPRVEANQANWTPEMIEELNRRGVNALEDPRDVVDRATDELLRSGWRPTNDKRASRRVT